MHITCVICSDLFTPNSDMYSTPCGHLFHYTCLLHWLENSKTCPQCRAKVSVKSLVRLYVTVAQSQGSDTDVTLLQNKLDSMEFNMKLKNQEMKNVSKKNQEMQEQNKGLRAKVKELELSEQRCESIVASYKEQVKYFKAQSQSCIKLQDEIGRLKNEVKNLEQVQVAVSGSRQQVEELIRNENSVESLALLAATLKKSLIDTDRKKKELQYDLKRTQNELSQLKRKMHEEKCEYEDTKRQLESLKLNYEKEVTFLKDKFSQLQAKATKGIENESLNSSIRRITSESPVNYNRTPVLSGNNGDFINLDDTPPCSATSQSSLPGNKQLDVVQDTTDDSPLPASSMGLAGIHRAKILASKADHHKFSIFKNNHSGPAEPVVVRTNYKSVDLTYDGLGGSSKEDIYPTPSGLKRPKTSKIKSSKFKKLSAEAGKPNRKMSEFINLT